MYFHQAPLSDGIYLTFYQSATPSNGARLNESFPSGSAHVIVESGVYSAAIRRWLVGQQVPTLFISPPLVPHSPNSSEGPPLHRIWQLIDEGCEPIPKIVSRDTGRTRSGGDRVINKQRGQQHSAFGSKQFHSLRQSCDGEAGKSSR